MNQISTTQNNSDLPHGWGRLATTCVAHMAEHLYVGVLTVVLPLITSSLGLTMAQAGLLVSARSLVAGLSNMPSGLLADLTQRRSFLLGLCLVFIGLSSLLMSFAPGFQTLLVFMALAGLGAGGFHPQSLAILSSAYRNRRALAIGVHDSSGNLGEVLGPLTIGTLLTYVTWRGTLQIWSIPGLLIGLLYAFLAGEVKSEQSTKSKFGLSLWEDVITNRTVLIVFAISIFRTMGQTSLLVFLPLYLALQLKLSPANVGAHMSILFLFAALAPSLSGWISDRVGRTPLILICLVVAAVSISAISTLSVGIPLTICLGVVGTALWAVRPVIFASAMEVAPPQMAGSLIGFLFTGNMGISAVAPLLSGFVADTYGLGQSLIFIGLFPLLACIVALASLSGLRR